MQAGLFNQTKCLTDPYVEETQRALSPNPGVPRPGIPFPVELGHGWVDYLALSADLVVYQTVHRPCPAGRDPMLSLADLKFAFSEPGLSVHTLHSGSARIRALQPQADRVLMPGQDLFCHGEQGHCIPELDTSTDVVMTALVISDKALLELIGEAAAAQLIQSLGLLDPPRVQVARIPFHITEPLRHCLSSGCTGPLHTLFAQSKILDYLWKLATFASSGQAAHRPAGKEVATLRALHEYLTQLEGEMPLLKDLASKFGQSPQTLNKGFQREYGQSIYAMVTGHRLDLAHQELLEGSRPIKTIATRLGYSHANHFTHAFKRKYGYTPGSLRRKPRDADQNR